MAEVVEIGLTEAKAANVENFCLGKESLDKADLNQTSSDRKSLDKLNNIRRAFSPKLSAYLASHSSSMHSSSPHLSSAHLSSHLWRASELPQHSGANTAIPSGFSNLDQHLSGSGWPEAGLTELLCTTTGVGELRLLIPALKRLSQQSRWIAWVNPPFVPYAPALAALGIDTSKILLIHPKTHKESLWALEQALKSGTCSTVLAWLDESKLKHTDTQRLQLASKTGKTAAFLFRPESAATKHSMAELRLNVQPQPSKQCDELNLSILKRRGGWPIEDLTITLQQTPIRQPANEIKQQLTLWRAFKERRGGFNEKSGGLDKRSGATEKQALPLPALNSLKKNKKCVTEERLPAALLH